MSQVHRSYSQVRQLRTCGEQFRLERIEKVPSRPSVAAVAGKAIHVGTESVDKFIENEALSRSAIVKQATEVALDDLDQQVKELNDKDWPVDRWKRYGRQDVAWYTDFGIPNAIGAYTHWRKETPDFVLADIPGFGKAVEVPFNLYVGGLLIHGWIDRVFTSVKAGGYYPIDLKSGRKPETDEQLGLYAQALREGLNWEVDYGYYIYGLKTGEASLTRPLNFRHWTKEKLDQVYGQANKIIQAGLFIAHPGDACFHCGVQEHCQFGQAVV